MILESGRVESVDNRFAWVVCAAQAGCARCAAGQGCGGGLLGRLLGDRLHRVRVAVRDMDLNPGDQVELGLEEAAIFRGALRVYGLPLLGLIALPLLLRALTGMSGDPIMLLAAVAGLTGGLLLARRASARIADDPAYQPVVMRRLERPCDPGD